MKTHSDISFKKLFRGNLKQSHPKHYAQCIVYSGKFDCVGALYMAVNKNNDELFFDYIPFNQEEFDEYCSKAEYITMADKPPDRIATQPPRSEEHTSELPSLMRISYAAFCFKKKQTSSSTTTDHHSTKHTLN